MRVCEKMEYAISAVGIILHKAQAIMAATKKKDYMWPKRVNNNYKCKIKVQFSSSLSMNAAFQFKFTYSQLECVVLRRKHDNSYRTGCLICS